MQLNKPYLIIDLNNKKVILPFPLLSLIDDPELHKFVCDTIKFWLDGLPDWTVLGLTQSPIKGPEGNIEFLIAAHKS